MAQYQYTEVTAPLFTVFVPDTSATDIPRDSRPTNPVLRPVAAWTVLAATFFAPIYVPDVTAPPPTPLAATVRVADQQLRSAQPPTPHDLGLVAPILVPGVQVPDSSWDSVGPDWLRLKTPPPVFPAYTAPVFISDVTSPAPAESWKGSYQDYIPRRPWDAGLWGPRTVGSAASQKVGPGFSAAVPLPLRVIQYTALVGSLQADTLTPTGLVDFAPPAPPRPWTPATITAGEIGPIYIADVTAATPTFAGLAIFPDWQLNRAPEPVRTGQAWFDGLSFDLIGVSSAVYPAWVVRAIPPTPSTTGVALVLTPTEAITIDKWQGYPPVAPPPPKLPPSVFVFPAYLADVTTPTPDLSWHGEQPGQVWAARRPVWTDLDSVEPVEVPGTTVPFLAGRSLGPDWLRLARRQTPHDTGWVAPILTPGVQVPFFTGGSVGPDWLRLARRLTPSDAGWTGPIFIADVTTPTPEESWWRPASVPVRRPVPVPEFPAWVEPIFIQDVTTAPPPLAAKSIGPDWLRAARPFTPYDTGWVGPLRIADVTITTPELSWRGEQPSLVLRVAARTPADLQGPLFQQEVVTVDKWFGYPTLRPADPARPLSFVTKPILTPGVEVPFLGARSIGPDWLIYRRPTPHDLGWSGPILVPGVEVPFLAGRFTGPDWLQYRRPTLTSLDWTAPLLVPGVQVPYPTAPGWQPQGYRDPKWRWLPTWPTGQIDPFPLPPAPAPDLPQSRTEGVLRRSVSIVLLPTLTQPVAPQPPAVFPQVLSGLILRRPRSVVLYPTFWKPVDLPFPVAIVAPTQGQWAFGGNPPRALRRAIERGWFVEPIRVADVTAAVPNLSWQPRYPDRLWRKAGPPEREYSVSFAAAIPFLDPSRFGWRGVYPDRIARRMLLAGQAPAVVLVSPSIFPIPNLSWKAIHPDWLPPATRPRTLGGVLDPFPLPNAAAPDLSWQGSQPAMARAALRVADRVWHVQVLRHTPFAPDFVSGLVIAPSWIPRRFPLAANSRTWSDRFEIIIPDIRQDWQTYLPDRIARKFVPLIPGVFTGAIVDRAISPVDWYGGGTTPKPRPIRPAASFEVLPPPPGALIIIGQQLAWRPDLPTLIRILATPLAEPTMVIPPPIIAGGVGCVELSGGAVTSPALLAMELTTPSLEDGVVTSPGLTVGEIC